MLTSLVKEGNLTRVRITIRGAVQGVGFRPFIYRLAGELDLAGWVNNSSHGVFIEAQGAQKAVASFLLRIEAEKPPRSFIQCFEYSFLDPANHSKFEIRESDRSEKVSALVLPDIATCSSCVDEIMDPANRRHLYPFTNCAHCGPRFSIVESLPYDRENTSMKEFVMCRACKSEYDNPEDRRFHAQANACPECGPGLELWNAEGKVLASRHVALEKAVNEVRQGKIVAVKGLGGFHLIADARNEDSIKLLRWRKGRDEKPLALMFPDLKSALDLCEVSAFEKRLLLSSESPIVILRKKSGSNGEGHLAPSIAPGNPTLGVMLPYTPLHKILMRELGFPIVATSGNFSEDTICIDNHEALERLKGIADVFLMHNRRIVQHVDDSIVHMVMGREQVLRRARGYAPLPVHVDKILSPTLAVGGHMKNAIAIASDQDIFTSQHIGDLENANSLATFSKVISHFKYIHKLEPRVIACDLHPDYASTRFAEKSGLPLVRVQHHCAHVLSCMAENSLTSPVLGVAWDGTGYGPDGTLWGGEFLLSDVNGFHRAAHMRTFRLPGGASAIREPRRAALGLLFEIYGNDAFNMDELQPVRAFSWNELNVIRSMLEKNINSPATSSAGRLFDAIASLIGLRQTTAFEGQAAMELEYLVPENSKVPEWSYPIELIHGDPLIIDWQPMVLGILADLKENITKETIALKFHNSLAESIVSTAKLVGENRIVLTGGCFQNRYLTERSIKRLRDGNFKPYWHQRIPPNDGGIALGQAVAAAMESGG